MSHTLPDTLFQLIRPCLWLLAATCLCTCSLGPSTPPQQHSLAEPVVVTFACRDHQRAQYQALVEDFQSSNPDIQVQFVSADEASGMQRQGNTVTMDGQEVQRLAAAADTFTWFNLSAGDWPYLLDLSPFMADPSFPRDDFYPGTLEHFGWHGGTYGLPAEVLLYLVYYNRDLFDAAGLSYPQAGWTWDDLIAAASQLTRSEGDTVTRYGFVDATPRLTLLAMAQQYGVPLWDTDADPPQPLFDTAPVAEVLQRYVDLVRVYGLMPEPEIGSNLLTSALIDGGQAAMWADAAWERDRYSSDRNVGVAPFPDATAAANPRAIYGFYISAGTAHPDAAWRWLSYLSANYQPTTLSDVLPGRRSVGAALAWWRQLDQDTRAVYDYVLAHPAVDDPLNRPLWSAAAAVFEDGVSVEQALANAQAQALGVQVELAQPAPAAPQAVASARPAPAAGDTVIRFAPAFVSEEALYRTLAATYEQQHPGVRIEIVPYPASLAELPTAADCFAAPALLADPASGMQSDLLSLDPLLSANPTLDLADFYLQFLLSVQHGGALWGLPYQADALMVYFNPDLLAAAGIEIPAPGWTIEGFLTTARALTGPGQFGFTTREGAYGDLLFVLERFGARLVDTTHDPARPTFDDPTVVEAFDRYSTFVDGAPLTPATSPRLGGWPDAAVMGSHPAGVAGGEVAMWIDSISYHAAAPPLPFTAGVVQLPTGTSVSTEFDILAFYISSHSAAPQACWEWISYLSAEPQVVTTLPARRSVASWWQARVEGSARPAYLATLEFADTSIFRQRWEIPWLAYTYPWLDAAFQAVVDGQDAQAALTAAQARAEQLLSCAEASGGFADREQLRTCAREVDPEYP